ncbi:MULTISPECIES: ABC transporter ATP-binding protein [unclassified Brenneria]|uniref:metal ABC transporter ATP-binding protein n=1 Tax=unclassified Brenneria TaxID=2634434 RepID=UPI0029C2BBBB|nr:MULTISPECIES: ABC transporter ATP-binding protein [unclassified Brenneria]MDX5628720.1 ABC transporter ATP-binding protein [Brenneria sp. L3-3Z]MDX5695859.1 ABC transporter ATP-binding protein [Brenneria sp. L4-2C]
MIALRELSFGYQRQSPLATLNGCFHAGSLTAIIGANGSGKSTLLKTLAGLLPPLAGAFSINNAGKNAIGYLPQLSEFDRQFPVSVCDLVLMGTLPHRGILRGIGAEWQDKAMRALDAVSMAEYAHQHIGKLSGGQLQRILFARLLLTQSPIILLDEPFTGIDSQTTQALLKIIRQLHDEGCTILAVLHDLDLVAAHFPQVLQLANGGYRWGTSRSILSDAPADHAFPALRSVAL